MHIWRKHKYLCMYTDRVSEAASSSRLEFLRSDQLLMYFRSVKRVQIAPEFRVYVPTNIICPSSYCRIQRVFQAITTDQPTNAGLKKRRGWILCCGNFFIFFCAQHFKVRFFACSSQQSLHCNPYKQFLPAEAKRTAHRAYARHTSRTPPFYAASWRRVCTDR